MSGGLHSRFDPSHAAGATRFPATDRARFRLVELLVFIAVIGDVTLGTVVPITWQHLAGEPLSPAATEHRVNAFGSLDPGGANFALCDGSVRFVAETMDQRIFQGYGTGVGGEIVTGY